ncbi:MAG: hypothetical protein NVV60_13790 [Luteimonas sp.]|nr:hypothetical protein [Luteimonas sp.]
MVSASNSTPVPAATTAGRDLSTYVLRQADRVVWFKVHAGNNDGSLLIAETDATPVE